MAVQVERRFAVEIERSKHNEQPVKRNDSHERSEREVHRPQHLVKEIKHASSFHPLGKGLKTSLTMLVAQSSRHYKNTNCLVALLENDGTFVTASYCSTPNYALFKANFCLCER
jgi:hypothetical protein